MDYFEQVDLAYQTLKGPALEDRLRELTDRCRAEYGERGALYGSMLNELGSYYRGQGRYEASERAFREALELLAQSRGTDSPDYATALNNLAGTHRLMGRLKEAEREFAACLTLYRETLGEGHILYAAGLNNLSLVCLDRGELERAAELQGRAARVLETMPDRRDELAAALCNLGELRRRQGRPEEAERCLLRALELFQRELGVDTPHYHAALNGLGGLCCEVGRYEEACRWFLAAAAAAEKLYGSEHREHRAALEHLRMARRAAEAGV